MTQFCGSLLGNRGFVTRHGSKKSGIEGHIGGWDVGVRVVCHYDNDTGKDVVRVYRTGGNNHPSDLVLIAEFTK